MSADLIAGLARTLSTRRAEGLLRIRRTIERVDGVRVTVAGRELVAFASNDYLGLSHHPALIAAARDAASRWGVGAGASHLVSGHASPHEALEEELAAFVRPCPGARALVFSTGYLANLAILTSLAGRGDAIFADKLNHACLNDGALLSRAELLRYAHADTGALEARLRAWKATTTASDGPTRASKAPTSASKAPTKLIATDAVFSMDGDIAPLPDLLALAEAHDAWLVVDDAHGFGVLGEGADSGRGSLAHFGLASERIVYMGTLGKAAGVAGAFVAAHPTVIDTLMQTARPYIYTTAAPPMLAEALRASLSIIRGDAARHAHLSALIRRFRERMRASRWTLMDSRTAIQPVVVGDNAQALTLSEALLAQGFWVPAIRPPTVPTGTARLRITLSAAHTMEDVDALTEALDSASPRTPDPR